MPGVLGDGTPLETFLSGPLPFPAPETPGSFLMALFDDAVAGVLIAAKFRDAGLGVVGFGAVTFGELIVAD